MFWGVDSHIQAYFRPTFGLPLDSDDVPFEVSGLKIFPIDSLPSRVTPKNIEAASNGNPLQTDGRPVIGIIYRNMKDSEFEQFVSATKALYKKHRPIFLVSTSPRT